MGYSITWNYSSKPYQEGDEYESNDLNMTYNLGRMMDWAFDSPDWDKDIKGKTGKEILPMVADAFHKMALNRKEAKQYDSPNVGELIQTLSNSCTNSSWNVRSTRICIAMYVENLSSKK